MDEHSYGLSVTLFDFQTLNQTVLKTDYGYEGLATHPYTPIALAEKLLTNHRIEFEVDSIPAGNPHEIYPAILILDKLTLHSTPKHVGADIHCVVHLVDGIVIDPYDNQGDIYDNMLGLGFFVTGISTETTSEYIKNASVAHMM